MPANVSFEFEIAKKKYDKARTPLEKLVALQEMQKTAPSHKGGENLRSDISRKIAQLKRDMEKQKEQAKKTGKGASLSVRKEGAGQIVLVGAANSGKSTLLKALTGAEVKVASYPFTTKKPEVGGLKFKGATIQMVEIPAIVEGSSEGKFQGMQLLSIVRNADAIVLVLTSLEEFELLKKELKQANILLNESKPKISVKRSKFPGISIAGKKFLKVKNDEFVRFLKSLGYHNASVLLEESTTLAKVTQSLDERLVYMKCLALTRDISFKHSLQKKFKGKVVHWHGLEEKEVNQLKKEMFLLLGKVLVYTKKPGREPDYNDPLVLDEGATVADVAKLLHKDFASKLKYVKVWGSAKFPGQRVAKSYKLKNEDLIEIYA
jgi:small GTP-binding protein